MATNFTLDLAEFVSNLKYESIPQLAREGALLGWTDCMISIVGGVNLDCVKIPYETLVKGKPDTDARLFFGKETASVADAAFINSVAAHGMDMDDIALKGSHPSAVLVPAILAEAEKLNASGHDVITAYVAGFEVWGHAIFREKDSYVKKGWHSTAMIGPIAAAAAVANLKGLSAEKTRNAMAIAAACASGTIAGWFGELKPFQVGRAAQSAITSVQLAEAGLYGSDEPLLGRGGLLNAISPNGNVDTESPIEGLGKNWQLVDKGLHTKLYPFPLSLHRSLEGAMELTKEHDLKPDDVAKVTVYIGPAQAKYKMAAHGALENKTNPNDSPWLPIACAIVMRKASRAEMMPEFHARPDVARFKDITHIEIDESIPDDPEPNLGFAKKIRLDLTDGTHLVAEDNLYYPGHWTRRFSKEQMAEKFDTFAAAEAEKMGLEGILERFYNIESMANINEIYDQ